jgi:hypothetical protein
MLQCNFIHRSSHFKCGAGGGREDFASVLGDSLLGEVENDIKKIKEIAFDARKNTGVSQEANAEYTKYTFMSRHHITRLSSDKRQ